MLKLAAIGRRSLGFMQAWGNVDEAKGWRAGGIATRGRRLVMREMVGFAALHPPYETKTHPRLSTP